MNNFYSGISPETTLKPATFHLPGKALGKKRIESIDLLRGTVMVIMALDHVRHTFHRDAFYYDPLDLTQTSPILFFTRFITHYCAPIFVFLAGVSAYLYGTRRTKKELSFYLLTRGLWMVFVELFIIVLCNTYNPTYPFFSLQVIWAIGISMIALAAIVRLSRPLILLTAIVLIGGHNLLDNVHVPGTGAASLLWALLHDPGQFVYGRFTILVQYPFIPWIGVITLGYYLGSLYESRVDETQRRKILATLGVAAIALFLILRTSNIYGDASHWSIQKNAVFSILSFLNVTKYPPSLLYVLITLGPALIFLALTEKPLNAFTAKLTIYGRVPFFYYVAHLALIHLLAFIGAVIQGYDWRVMILHTKMNSTPELKGFGYSLAVTYAVWMGVVLFLYPFCKKYDIFKRKNQASKSWLTYV